MKNKREELDFTSNVNVALCTWCGYIYLQPLFFNTIFIQITILLMFPLLHPNIHGLIRDNQAAKPTNAMDLAFIHLCNVHFLHLLFHSFYHYTAMMGLRMQPMFFYISSFNIQNTLFLFYDCLVTVTSSTLQQQLCPASDVVQQECRTSNENRGQM